MPYSLLYIDPGTGSMMFSILIALATTCVFGARAAWMKLRFIITRGKKEKADSRNRGIVIFSDDKRYWNVFGPICREAERRGVDIVYMTQSADDPALKECVGLTHIKAEFIGEGNKGIAKMNFLVADVVLSTTPNLDVFQWKRSREVKYYVHTQHGVGDQLVYRMFALDSYDAVLLASGFQGKQVRAIEKLHEIPQKELLTVGYPPLDEAAKRLTAIGDPPVTPRAALAASPVIARGLRSSPRGNLVLQEIASQATQGGIIAMTEDSQTRHRPLSLAALAASSVLVAPSWGSNSLLSRFGARLLSALSSTGYKIIVRPHPQTVKSEQDVLSPLMKEFPATDKFEWNFDTDNFECLRHSSIMVSDFSSVIFEYAFLFERPVIYTDVRLDTSVMDAAWMPDSLWCVNALSEIGIRLEEENISAIKDVIDSAITSKTLKESIGRVKADAWQCQGEGAARTVDYLVKKQREVQSQDEDIAQKAAS